MRKSRDRLILVITIFAISRSATSASSTASTFSSTQKLDTTTKNDETYTSSQSTVSFSTDIPTTTSGIDTTVEPTSMKSSTESGTTTGDLSTTTAASDTTVDDLSTTTTGDIDFTTSDDLEPSTTDLETTSSEQITTETSTQFTDLTTSAAAETTTSLISSRASTGISTTVDQDTTIGESTTITDSPTTSTQPDVTTPSLGEETTSIASGQLCQTRDEFEKDDVRNYVIIALSVALGTMSISVMIWCVISRLFVNVKKTMISAGTQTDFFISKEIYVRPLPPIDTHMKKSNPFINIDRNTYEDKKYPMDVRVDIDPDNPPFDNKLDTFSECECRKVKKDEQIKECREYDGLHIQLVPEPTESSCMSNEDIKSTDTDLLSEDMNILDSEEFFNLIFVSEYPKTEDPDSLASITGHPRSVSNSDSISSLDKMKERRDVVHDIPGIDNAPDEKSKNKENVIGTSMKNKKTSFQANHSLNVEEPFEEVINLDTDETKQTMRHVTFAEPKEQIMNHSLNCQEADQEDCVVTLVSPKYSRLVNSETNTVELTDTSNPGKLSISRRRKKVHKNREINTDVIKTLPLSQIQKKYLVTYGIISNECSTNPDIKMTKSLRKIIARKTLKIKANSKKKWCLPKPELKFQSEPYSSLYSRLSHFET